MPFAPEASTFNVLLVPTKLPPLCTVIAPWLEPVALTVRLNPFAAVILEFVPPIRIVGPVTTAKAAELVKVPPPVTATWPVESVNPAVTPAPPVSVAFVPLTVTLRPAVAVVVDTLPSIVMSLESDFTSVASVIKPPD